MEVLGRDDDVDGVGAAGDLAAFEAVADVLGERQGL